MKKQKVIFEVKPIVQKIDWSKVPVGSSFKGFIGKKAFSGKIQKEQNEIYLCQNIEDGYRCSDKLGYLYSYTIGQGNIVDMKCNEVLITKISAPEKLILPNIEILSNYVKHSVKFSKGYIQIGCMKIYNEKIREIIKYLKD